MSSVHIALIEGDEKETEFIQQRILSNLEGGRCDHFKSIAAFQESSAQVEDYQLIISDLLEEFTPEMTEQELVDELAKSFSGLLDKPYEDKDQDIVFLTKVPVSYIKEAISEEIDRFPVAEHTLGGILNKSGISHFSLGYISIIEKPYLKEDDGSLTIGDETKLSQIISRLNSKISS